MEYEICGEERLFDDSTNPSLEYESKRARRDKASVSPQDAPAEKRREQVAVAIPEEEHQLG